MSQNPPRGSVNIGHAQFDFEGRESMFTVSTDRRGQSSAAQTIADSFSPPIELEQLVNPDEVFQKQLPSTPKFVKWGVQWHKEPTYMILFALGGLLLGIGHHCYYNSLSGTEAGSNQRQQWAHNFGNILAVLVVATLHRANGYAYSQLFWGTVRGRSFTLGSLDKMFSLTTDPMGFFNLEVFRHAPFAVALALLCWSMGLAGILPPGTLVVVSGTVGQVTEAFLPVLNWKSLFWGLANRRIPGDLNQLTELVSDIAAQSAVTMDVLRFSPTAPNSSYTLQVQGPYLQCKKASSTGQSALDYYTQRLATNADNAILTPSGLNDFTPKPHEHHYLSMLYFSAFDPMLGKQGLRWPGPDQYNNWNVDLPPTFTQSFPLNISGEDDAGSKINYQVIPRQLWVQTTENSIICTLGNATREVNFHFVDGVQTISYGELQGFAPLYVWYTRNNFFDVDLDRWPYVAVYLGLTNLLSGNITTQLQVLNDQFGYNTLVDSSSRVLLTGLDACRDFTENTWSTHPISRILSENGSIQRSEGRFYNNLFDKHPSSCRNHTLERAIEDLATNITISMMTSSNLTSISQKTTEVHLFPTRNLYHYNPLYLLLSYGLAFLFTTLSISLGLYTFHTNGVIHGSTFSSIIMTTRNSKLDEISKGSSLGRPLDKELKMLRLRFGAINMDGKVERAAFGVGDKVGALKKGGRYV
ncbi:hypothetical protein LARI1_G004665 [Lachnellula arida]|uniref:Uncharacterized protein n=1 Tax=Lachnellula arida TaxID=1316785 RepID=A0A8T9BBW7_9HELO|nr:hypothetical protein LARI1_G004665 [Lachnellula arida]